VAGGAEYVLLPEVETDVNKVCLKIIEGNNRGKLHSIIMVAEGASIKSAELTKIIEEKTGKETKQVVLSYLQRGGSPTLNDRMLATLTAEKAVELLKNDSQSKAIGTCNGNIVAYDLKDVLKLPKSFNQDLYDLVDVLSK